MEVHFLKDDVLALSFVAVQIIPSLFFKHKVSGNDPNRGLEQQ